MVAKKNINTLYTRKFDQLIGGKKNIKEIQIKTHALKIIEF